VVAVAAQVALFLLIGGSVGAWLYRLAVPGAEVRIPLPEQLALAYPGFVLFATVLMVVHRVVGGRVFSNPVVVLVAAALVLWRLPRPQIVWPARRSLMAALLFAVVLLVLYMAPVIAGGSSVRMGDPPWHLGWTEQLLRGEAVPSGPAAAFARNAYPWGYHATLASLVRLVPGSGTLTAHDAMHVLLLAGIPAAAAVLARLADRRAGWGAAWAAAGIGGWGWVQARGPSFSPSPRVSRYGADLVVASPNSVYELFPPPLPRELGLVLAAVAIVVVARAVRGPRAVPSAADSAASGTGSLGALPSGGPARAVSLGIAGVVVGVVGLVSVPMMLTISVWVVVTVAPIRGPDGARSFATILVVAALVFGLWVVPVGIDYLRYGGFVDISPVVGREWPLPTALGAWGLLLPLAALGAVITWRRPERILVGLLGATAILLALAVARSTFSWHLLANETLLHQGRFWPPAHLVAAALAGVAVTEAWRRLRMPTPWRRAAFVAAAVVAGASLPLASIELARVMDQHQNGFVYGARDLTSDDSFVTRAAGVLGPDDVVEVRGSDPLAFFLFQFSGARLTGFDDPLLEGNDVRIRFAELAAAWNEQARQGAPAPDHVVELRQGESQQGVLVSGTFGGREWVLLRAPRDG